MPTFRVERRAIRLADLSREALRALITELNAQAENLGCLVLRDDAPCDRVMVIFAGHLERFHMLAAARHLTCPVIYVQDLKSGWYQGSDLLPELTTFCREFLVSEVGPSRALFFGQSSGAYAALAASTYVRGATVVACGPQSFSDASAKDSIHFIGVRALRTPDGLLDLRQLILARPDPTALRAILISASESENPVQAHFWMDYLHSLRLHALPQVALFILNVHSHSLVHTKLNSFALLVSRMMGCVGFPTEARLEMLQSELHRVTSGEALE